MELIINTLNPLLEAGTCSLAFKQLSEAHTLLEIVAGQVGECPFMSACMHWFNTSISMGKNSGYLPCGRTVVWWSTLIPPCCPSFGPLHLLTVLWMGILALPVTKGGSPTQLYYLTSRWKLFFQSSVALGNGDRTIPDLSPKCWIQLCIISWECLHFKAYILKHFYSSLKCLPAQDVSSSCFLQGYLSHKDFKI